MTWWLPLVAIVALVSPVHRSCFLAFVAGLSGLVDGMHAPVCDSCGGRCAALIEDADAVRAELAVRRPVRARRAMVAKIDERRRARRRGAA